MDTVLWAGFWRSIGVFFLLTWGCSGIFICMLLPLTLQDSETSLTQGMKNTLAFLAEEHSSAFGCTHELRKAL